MLVQYLARLAVQGFTTYAEVLARATSRAERRRCAASVASLDGRKSTALRRCFRCEIVSLCRMPL